MPLEAKKKKKRDKMNFEDHFRINQGHYSLADVGYGVHPTANADLVAYIRRVAELMNYGDVIGIGTLEELTFQCHRVNLKRRGRIHQNKPPLSSMMVTKHYFYLRQGYG